ncbi:Hypothetical protein GL50581_949 [Giardia duodenalis ATCC 50581]|uniref:Uncharacterized protein n=1 Tax=Giardia intestinalis (strain ATCC 50581 / GS clone H7) TaxID=598745 RepID=C6LQC5_GIAIB|nr:Hypothetical protein GL50581_949 [Giardia intestinalis ATCC 50581]
MSIFTISVCPSMLAIQRAVVPSRLVICASAANNRRAASRLSYCAANINAVSPIVVVIFPSRSIKRGIAKLNPRSTAIISAVLRWLSARPLCIGASIFTAASQPAQIAAISGVVPSSKQQSPSYFNSSLSTSFPSFRAHMIMAVSPVFVLARSSLNPTLAYSSGFE